MSTSDKQPEIYDYALKIGINVENEPHLLYLARDGLMEALPPGWKPCYDEDRKEIYYFNFKTCKAQWEHPLDEVYRSLVKKVRSESVTTDQLDDDSQTSIKEDLKSFEEASLIFPPSEMYTKPKVLEPLSPLSFGAFRKCQNTQISVLKPSSRELLKGGTLKLPLEADEDLLLAKNSENELNPLKKTTFDDTEVRKRPNSSDIRNRRNIGPMEFRHLSKQEIIIPKSCGKNSFLAENRKLSDITKVTDVHGVENKTSESGAVTKDEGYGTEFSVSSLGEKEGDARGNAGKKELTLTGGGSVFLKTNKNKFSPSSDLVSLTFSKEELSDGLGSSLDGKKSSSEVDTHSKGILRDQKSIKSKEKELTKISDETKSISHRSVEDDRKSVRFQLEKDLKINFELPRENHTDLENITSFGSDKSFVTDKRCKSEAKDNTKQIEIDFEDLDIDLVESIAGDEQRPPVTQGADLVDQQPLPLTLELKTVKPKKFKSSQTLVQEFREIFEVKNKTKINIPISSPLKVEEANTKSVDESKAEVRKGSGENEGIARRSEWEKPGPSLKSSADVLLKPISRNLIDLYDADDTKDSSSIADSQIDSGKTDRSFRLKDEVLEPDFSGLVDFASKIKVFESTQKPESPRDTSAPKAKSIYKERNLLMDEILKLDEVIGNNQKTDGKSIGEDLISKPKMSFEEKKEEETPGKYDKRKSEKIKNLEASFNEWLSDTEKLFEEKKSNALIKMKEKFEDWKANRESEFAKMYNEKREEETQNKFKELRNEFVKREQEEMDRLRSQLDAEKTERLSRMKIEFESEMQSETERTRKLLDESLREKKLNLLEKHKEELEKIERSFQEALTVKETQKAKEVELARESERAVEILQKELKDSYQKQKNNMVKEHELLLDNMRQQHAVSVENLRIELKNEEDSLRKFHATHLDEMKVKLSSLEARKLDIKDNHKSDITESRIYEKVRCEKRLLEDKYKTLKEKYIRLKSDGKLSLDKKHKKDVATGSETEKSSSNKSNSIFRRHDCDSSSGKRNQENDKKAKLKKPFANLDNVGQYTSTEEEENINSRNTYSAASPMEARKLKKSPDPLIKNKKKDDQNVLFGDSGKEDRRAGFELTPSEDLKNHANETKKRRQIFSRLKAASTSRINFQNRSQDKESTLLSPVENLRRQLKKLEELEDQFPVTTHTDTYMRYPFTDIPQVGSSEIEFFKHRIHLERESVRRAKESLKSQKKSFETRQRELKQKLLERGPEAKSTTEQVYQEERELTDMEVSVHRTRALLGEKIIRLRHLEQSLKRISEPRKKDSFMNKDLLGRLGFRSQTKDDDRTLSDLSSHSGSSGFSSTDFNVTDTHNLPERGWTRVNVEDGRRQCHNNMHEPSEIIQSLENLNSEISEIWEVLKKQQQSGQGGALRLPPPPLIYNDGGWPTFSVPSSLAFRNTVITSNANGDRSVAQQLKNQVTGNPNFGHVTTVVDSSLVDRTRSLRDWLKAARNSSAPSEVISSNQVTL